MYTSPFFKDFPEIKDKNKGKFTAWAKKNGFEDACSAATAVMAKKDKYSDEVVKMANYANNFGCKNKK
jgi:hypothetical protein|tara:strand:+ start:120 stop:323 length:204 start_codon:yes stop_codon:yes gene_type:complete